MFLDCKHQGQNLSALLDQFIWTVSQALGRGYLAIRDLMQISPTALDRVLEVNKQAPMRLDIWVRDKNQKWCRQSPETPAVSSWDETFTYGELDRLAAKLASLLIYSGVRREKF
ncbi:hypothetical protein BO83DRAFT_425854 [Aspergillus eucalypticola CBS 122712]|uniref:Uncharacterized protein n=1 Tax=Aspergillus eucalypticola (strain CBS 122712 / IBT 29274) TaxID=1448314 RepID=A0A317VPM3_ASPEC|nr:uncharacterized protein BO83DRAFT_425854 [Aspergillus eucalypticola CBS 122712]PWY75559.1 hypothetical protein BO83DRAFT_425854 [Aspergillus eucalypticola CBS 122712]